MPGSFTKMFLALYLTLRGQTYICVTPWTNIRKFYVRTLKTFFLNLIFKNFTRFKKFNIFHMHLNWNESQILISEMEYREDEKCLNKYGAKSIANLKNCKTLASY